MTTIKQQLLMASIDSVALAGFLALNAGIFLAEHMSLYFVVCLGAALVNVNNARRRWDLYQDTK